MKKTAKPAQEPTISAWGAKIAAKLRSNAETFVKQARGVHGDKYDYSKVVYVNARTKVTITCPEHGDFQQVPDSHARNGSGCPGCRGARIASSKSFSNAEFVKRARSVHGKTYNYSKVEYVNYMTEVTIICAMHGEFEQKPANHLAGHGCARCGQLRTMEASYLTKTYVLNGEEVLVQGFEPEALDYIQKVKGIAPSDIVVGSSGKVPTIRYYNRISKRTADYYPDILIVPEDRVVEVKCVYTLTNSEDVYRTNCAKAKATMKAGHKFSLILFDDEGTKRLKLPNQWYDMSYADMLEYLNRTPVRATRR